MASEKIVAAVQRIGIGLLDAFKIAIAGPEAAPPVGAQDIYGGPTAAPPAAVAAGGGGILLLLLVVYLLTGRKAR